MRADLHIHTYFSDGKCSPREIAALARTSGTQLISMTDHDTMGGLGEKRAAAEAEGLLYVGGWEISAYTSCMVHMLGYNCRTDGAYQTFLQKRKEGALARAEDMLKKANACLGTDVSVEDALAEMSVREAPLHTQHVVRACAKKAGACAEELYQALFSVGKPAYSDIGRPTPYDALEVIRATGGIAVLAHPGRIHLEREALVSLMDSLVDRGLDGIECSHSQHTAEQTEFLMHYADGRGLLKTGGSDFHRTDSSRKIGQPLFEADDRLLCALGLRR